MSSAALLLLVGSSAMLLSRHCLTASKPSQEQIAKNITNILNTLVDPSVYDKRLRPNYGGEPVNVGITIYVSSISAVSEVAMDYTLDIYLRQSWTDPRLAFTSFVDELTIDVNYQRSIWVPDTFFPNEKQSYFHVATTHNSFLRIDAKGNVRTSQRITVTATCPMHLQLFPLDSQECTLEIESYGYSTADINYYWQFKQGSGAPVSIAKSVTLPQFSITNVSFVDKMQVLTTGNYSRLACQFNFCRNIGFYLIQIYLPSQLIVIISWVSFWLSRDATPARVALGIMTVLTMTTLMTTTNAALPKVSYVKSIDIYLITCYSMVFAALLEYAAVCYLSKIMKRRKEKRVQVSRKPNNEFETAVNGRRHHRALHPHAGQICGTDFVASSPNNNDIQQLFQEGIGATDTSPKICTCPLDKRASKKFISFHKKRGKGQPRELAVTPSDVDKYSRILFPALFGIFNGLYWGIYLRISNYADTEPAG